MSRNFSQLVNAQRVKLAHRRVISAHMNAHVTPAELTRRLARRDALLALRTA